MLETASTTLPAQDDLLTARAGRSPQDNAGYRGTFKLGHLTLGVMFPIEAFDGDTPSMSSQVELAQFAEQAGFASLGFRDVPLRDPAFGDVGQIYDPWVYMAHIAAQTRRIALMTTAIILPLRHPIHTAKSAASLDRLAGGRLLLGVASGDRAVEFPAFGIDHASRGENFREQLLLLKTLWGHDFPAVASSFGRLAGTDVVPKPFAERVPLIVAGASQSGLDWIARHADGWITYPRELRVQREVAAQWQAAVEAASPGQFKPFAQSYYIDLADNPAQAPTAIHLGHRLGRRSLCGHLGYLREAGVHHVVLNLKYGTRPAAEVMQELAEHVVPDFRLAE